MGMIVILGVATHTYVNHHYVVHPNIVLLFPQSPHAYNYVVPLAFLIKLLAGIVQLTTSG